MFRVLDKEASGDWRVGIEADFEPMKERKEFDFDMSGDCVVVSLEDRRKDGVRADLDIVYILDIRGFEVREAELRPRS